MRAGRVNPPCDLKVRFFKPPEDLAGCFSVVYRADLVVEDDGRIEDVLLPEWTNIRIFRGTYPIASLPDGEVSGDARLVATGPTTHGTMFSLGTTRMWGVGLFPEGLARLTDLHADHVANTICDAEESPAHASIAGLADHVLSCEPDDDCESEAIFQFFRERLKPVRHLEQIRQIHRALLAEQSANAGHLADEAGLGRRHLERLGKRYFGFTPKALLRRQRFVRTLATFVLQRPVLWTAAMDSDYYDQAQFTREFREFMDMTPQQFAAMPHPIQDVFMVERAKLWGSPAQALDLPD